MRPGQVTVAIDIVQIRDEHIESFHAALDVVCRERMYLAFLEAPPIESTREFVRRNITRNNVQLVALDLGRVVGWCDVTPKDRPVMRHCGVLGMGLLPEWRGRGLGAGLLRQALEDARARGLVRVELGVRSDNARALALYRSLGFRMEGLTRRALLVDGSYYDVIMMAVLLDEVA